MNRFPADGQTSDVAAVLFDRDGTLVVDVPYNGDPERVVLRPGAAQAVARLRAAGVRIGLVTNQSGIGRGLVSAGAVGLVNARVGDLVGGFDAVAVCPHAPADGCDCRKPSPRLVWRVAAALGVEPSRCHVVGDRVSDVAAAWAAGATASLVDADDPLALERVVEQVLARRSGLAGAA